MFWKKCSLLIEKSTNIYQCFRNYGETSSNILVVLYNIGKKRPIYSTLVLDDDRRVGIIGGEEQYCWHNLIIIAYHPIEDVPEDWKHITQNKSSKDNAMKKIGIVVDYQYDFINPNGTMYVKGSEKIKDKIIEFVNKMDGIVFTLDWHPFAHCSFTEYGGQWNRHCVHHTTGATIPTDIISVAQDKPTLFLEKGTTVEEYGAFENGDNCSKFCKWLQTFWNGSKKENEFEIYVCGVAGDYCVTKTILSFLNVKPKTVKKITVVKDLCPCIDATFDIENVCRPFGVDCVDSANL